MKRTLVVFAGCLLLLPLLALVVLRLMPAPHRPLEYMIAGTATTAAILAGVLVAHTSRPARPRSAPVRPCAAKRDDL